MSVFTMLFCLAVAVFSAIREKDVVNPLTLFFGFWFALTALAAMRLYGLFEASARAYLVIVLGLGGFLLGYVLVRLVMGRFDGRRRAKAAGTSPMLAADRYRLNYPLLYVLYGIVLAYLVYRAVTVVGLLKSGHTLSMIRDAYFFAATEGDSPSVLRFVQTYVINMLIYVLLAVGFVDFFAGERKRLLLALTFAIVVLNALENGGRLVLYRFAANAVVGYLLFIRFNHKLRSNRLVRWAILAIPIAAAVGMLAITQFRSTSVKTVYFYFSGCVYFLGERMGVADLAGHSTHGFATFGGLVRPVFVALDNLGILRYPQAYLETTEVLRSYVEPGVMISPEMYYNAYVTPFFYFYLDGRLPAVIAGSVLYGALCGAAYHRVRTLPNVKNAAVYLLLAEELLTSMIRWQFNVPSYALAFPVLLFAGIFLRRRAGGRNDAGDAPP